MIEGEVEFRVLGWDGSMAQGTADVPKPWIPGIGFVVDPKKP